MRIIDVDVLIDKISKFENRKDIDKFLKKYGSVEYISILLVNHAEELIAKGEYDKGIAIILAVYESKYLKDMNDEVTVYLRLAEFYYKSKDIERCKMFLIMLCNETADNYEEAIEFRKLTPVWNRYKHLVEGRVRESRTFNAEEKILNNEELLELLLEEVNSGGFDAYLSYNGSKLDATIAAARELKYDKTADLLEKIKEKFPEGKVPSTESKIQDAIEKYGIDFDDEDDYFYSKVQNELL